MNIPKNNKPACYVTLVLCLVLIAAAGLLYGNFLRNPLVFDDEPWFENVADIYAQLSTNFGLRWFSYASIAWTWSIAGLDLFWLRLGNLLLHAANAVVLFIFLRQLFECVAGEQKPPAVPDALSSAWLAFFGALLFTLHPVAVYGVAYLMQRSILMATLFSLLALLSYLQGLVRGKQVWFMVAAACYFLAIFSKEHSVMVPAVALALTFLLRRPSISLFKQIAPVFILFGMTGLSVILMSRGVIGSAYEPTAQIMMGLMSDSSELPSELRGLDKAYIYPLSVLTQSFLFFKYLFLWILPYPGWMSVDLREPLATQFWAWPHTLGLVGFVLYGVVAVRVLLARRTPNSMGSTANIPAIHK